jgi:hypothetical protein
VGSVNSGIQKLKSNPLINEVLVFLTEKDQSTPFLCPLSDNDNIYVIHIPVLLHKSTGKYYTVYKKHISDYCCRETEDVYDMKINIK